MKYLLLLYLSYAPLRTPHREIQVAAIRYNVPVELAHAVAEVESNTHPWMINKGCVGMMQVNLPVWRCWFFPPLTRARLLDPAVNADIGCWILKHYYDRTGSWDGALFMFNNGYKHRNFKYVPKIKKYWRGNG